VGLMRL